MEKIIIHLNLSSITLSSYHVDGLETIVCGAPEFSKLCENLLNEAKNIHILTPSPKDFIKECTQYISYNVACGGYITNNNNAVLFIYRRNKWDLPKGKLETGETREECAIREVQEETNVKDISIINLRIETFHVFISKQNKLVLKHNYWYNMHSNDTNLIPQLEEDIEKVEWVMPIDIAFKMQNTFKSIEEVVYAKPMH